MHDQDGSDPSERARRCRGSSVVARQRSVHADQRQGKHLEITEAIENYVRSKCERLTRYFDKVQSITCVIEKEHKEFHVEFIVDVEHHEDFIANYRDADLYAAIDLAVDREARQITEHKSRIRDHKHPH